MAKDLTLRNFADVPRKHLDLGICTTKHSMYAENSAKSNFTPEAAAELMGKNNQTLKGCIQRNASMNKSMLCEFRLLPTTKAFCFFKDPLHKPNVPSVLRGNFHSQYAHPVTEVHISLGATLLEKIDSESNNDK